MRPKPFLPQLLNGDERFIRDGRTGTVWHRAHLRTLYADTDRSSVVYHANYLRYFEFGRASLMRDFEYPYAEVEEKGYVYPIISQSIDYYHPLRYDDPMWVHTRPGELERVRITFDYVITHAETGQLICRGYTRHCALKASGAVTAVDDETVRMWKAFPR
ncbi:MAG: acyl-CoA thioesterase [Desulfatibacillaceae bacterium]